jgi:Aldos-2-ulose dehydratase, beta-propeller domain/FG-GAP-like repeat
MPSRIAALAISIGLCTPVLAADEVAFPRFQVQEIATDLKVGYAVLVADINADGKPDLVVVDTQRVVWYENPSWKVHTIIRGKTRPDNVCVAALDIDGDGQLDLVLGADWKPFNTKEGGTLQWLKRGKTLDDEWSIYPIGEEPTVHRVRIADVDGSGKPQIVLAPLMGRDSSPKGNWMDGRPVRLLAYPIPKDPVKGPWEPRIVDESLHVVHNIWPIPKWRELGNDLLVASYEGVSIIQHQQGKYHAVRLGDGNQANPKGSRGSSEVKLGKLKSGKGFIATIEPWHGNQVVVYSDTPEEKTSWRRHVVDDHLRWGHAVWCADLDGDGEDELIVGVRDDPNPKQGDTFTERRGVRIYKCTDGKGEKWARQIIEDGGVAVEDLAAADLDGDGKIDIIAVGRQTGNARIYWNRGMEKK